MVVPQSHDAASPGKPLNPQAKTFELEVNSCRKELGLYTLEVSIDCCVQERGALIAPGELWKRVQATALFRRWLLDSAAAYDAPRISAIRITAVTPELVVKAQEADDKSELESGNGKQLLDDKLAICMDVTHVVSAFVQSPASSATSTPAQSVCTSPAGALGEGVATPPSAGSPPNRLLADTEICRPVILRGGRKQLVLVLLRNEELKSDTCIFVQKSNPAIGVTNTLEILDGSFGEGDKFIGDHAELLEAHLGHAMHRSEMVDLSSIAFGSSRGPGVYVGGGASEVVSVFLFRRTMRASALAQLEAEVGKVRGAGKVATEGCAPACRRGDQLR
eukprot:GHVT01005759.1.p1 GENE.GHVT01005759.1~~GHVT01005759.1.p1  ORF type:complete len:334 (-),score=77.71 GHVT01005759.1:227-1228(-)